MTDDRKRIFVVGCGRSGTTLLQAMLSAHEEIISFPESQFFASLIDQFETRVMGSSGNTTDRLLTLYQSLLIGAGIAPRPFSGVCAINRFIDKAGLQSEKIKFDHNCIKIKYQIEKMIALMDAASDNQHKKVWLLKTPVNVSYIDIIDKYVPDARFIHIARPGKDVVASIYDAAVNYPDTAWQRRYYKGSLSRLAGMWNTAIKNTCKYLNRPNHMLVLYNNLASNTTDELTRIFAFLGVHNDITCADRYTKESARIVSGNEKWKSGISETIKAVNKFDRVFNDEQKRMIEKHLDAYDLDDLNRL